VSRNVCLALLVAGASLLHADDGQGARRPLGIFARADIEDAITSYPGYSPSSAELHFYVRQLFAGLLLDPAISGITVAEHWDNIQLSDPALSADGSDGYDWSYLDVAFAQANLAHKPVQLIITPGVDAPPWLLAKIPSCDGLFPPGDGTARADCGKVTFSVFPESQRADGNVLPLPWNSVYQAAWWDFLTHLNARYGTNPAFVSIAVAEPVAASDEFILPTTFNGSFQQASVPADDAWSTLINHSFPKIDSYQNTDQAFIDQWEQTIDAYERIFSGITLFLGPDAGQDLPEFKKQNPGPVIVHPDNTLWAIDCNGATPDAQPRSCEAKTEILSYFVTEAGPNSKATQVGGMTASSAFVTGNIGVPGVKVLTSLSASFLGGAEFDHPVSSGPNVQQQGCTDFPMSPSSCAVTAEEGAYNTLEVFFYGTPAAAYYGGTPGPAPMQYVDIDYMDVQYAQTTPCPSLPSTIPGQPSLQDLFNRASRDLFAIAGQQTALPPSTCQPTGPPGLTIVGYQFVSEQPAAAGKLFVTYSASLINTGGALDSVTATASSLNPYAIILAPGEGTLKFSPVPANSQVMSIDTFTILVDPTVPFDFSQLQWTFQTKAAHPVANAGANQTVNIGTTVTLDGSGSTNPSGAGALTYSWMFSSRPPGTNSVLTFDTTVSPSFVADVAGTYVITLTVSNGAADNTASVAITAMPAGRH
jgi:PKD domain